MSEDLKLISYVGHWTVQRICNETLRKWGKAWPGNGPKCRTKKKKKYFRLCAVWYLYCD